VATINKGCSTWRVLRFFAGFFESLAHRDRGAERPSFAGEFQKRPLNAGGLPQRGDRYLVEGKD
jgi:hypothetical protein